MSTSVVTSIKTWVVSEAFIFSFLAFAIPLFLATPQIITGTLVNCLLFLAAQRLSRKEQLAVIIMPSLGALGHGILFGPQTFFLYYFLPIIWLGNFVLVWTFSNFPSLPSILKITIAAFAKFLILQNFASLYVHFHIVPPVFIITMGFIQLLTALLGGVVAFGASTYLGYERNQHSH